MLLAPALLAAATAFVNAASTNSRGLRGLLDDTSPKRSRRASAGGKKRSRSGRRTKKASTTS